nr:MinD/ParA family protein [Antrihabitans stalagmiti]
MAHDDAGDDPLPVGTFSSFDEPQATGGRYASDLQGPSGQELQPPAYRQIPQPEAAQSNEMGAPRVPEQAPTSAQQQAGPFVYGRAAAAPSPPPQSMPDSLPSLSPSPPVPVPVAPAEPHNAPLEQRPRHALAAPEADIRAVEPAVPSAPPNTAAPPQPQWAPPPQQLPQAPQQPPFAQQPPPPELQRTQQWSPPPPQQPQQWAPPPAASQQQPQNQQWSAPPNYQQPPQQYGRPAPGMYNSAPQQAPSIDEVRMLRTARRQSHAGWRRALHQMSGGAINPSHSSDDLYYRALVDRIRQPVRGDYRIAVLSLKGGVGKTTTTIGLGSTFASLRGDRVIAVDANPDFGTLAQRVPLQTRSTVRDLLQDPSIFRYSDVRAHTSQAPSRLEVLASERDPAKSEAFSEEDYRGVTKILHRFYNIILTDCGTGLMHSAMSGVLDLTHTLVLVSSTAIDGARSASATLDWLTLHGYDNLVRNAVVVLNSARPGAPNVDIQQLSQHFLARCRAVHVMQFDDHLAEGAEVDLASLHKATSRSFVEIAATISDDFDRQQPPRS